MEYREISIIDSGADKYSQRASDRCLGRRYDNDAVVVRIIKPQNEQDSACFMIVTNEYGQVLDHIDITSGEAPIKQHISRYGSIHIGFSFSRPDGYVKNCSFEKYTFAPALDPNSTVEIEPEQKENLDLVIRSSFVDVKWKEGSSNTIQYLNSKGDVVKEIQIKAGIDNTIDNLVNYYLKAETYNREEVNNLIKTINSFKKEIVDTLPTENIDENTIYLVPKQDGTGNDYYDEYLYINGSFEFIGSTQVNLTDYVKFTDYATKDKGGVSKINTSFGVDVLTTGSYTGTLRNVPATPDVIKNRQPFRNPERTANPTTCQPITSGNLDYAVKQALTNIPESGYTDAQGEYTDYKWTEEEKAKVLEFLGAADKNYVENLIAENVGDINTALESILGV